MGDERIDIRGIAFVFSTIEVLIQGTDVFAPETLNNQDDDIPSRISLFIYAIQASLMDRRIDSLSGFFTLEVMRHLEDIFSDGADE